MITADKVGEEIMVQFRQKELLLYRQVYSEKVQARHHGKDDQGLAMSRVGSLSTMTKSP